MKKIIILIAVIIIVLIAAGYAYLAVRNKEIVLEPAQAKAKLEKFINEKLMQPGQKATVKEIIDEGSLYKAVVDIGSGQDINSYLTKDGAKFFPQAMDLEETKAGEAAAGDTAKEDNQSPVSVVTIKKDKPTVEIFVMSHCPYGTQIEKGILPVIETLGDKVDFSLKFCDYAMHGEQEINEQLRQYCIQSEQRDKLVGYLNCFLKEGKSDECLSEVGVNTAELASCVTAADEQYKVTEMYNDQSSWKSGRYPAFNVNQTEVDKYGITGSPGLVINGQKVQSNRDSASLLNIICSGFNNQPAECSKSLSAVAPSPGFGFGSSGSNSGGGCGN